MADGRRVTVTRARPIASSFTGEALDVGTANGEQGQRANAAPAGELAQVQRVGLAGQAAVPGQEPGEGGSFGVGEGWLDHGERGGWGGSGHRVPLATLEPGGWACPCPSR